MRRNRVAMLVMLKAIVQEEACNPRNVHAIVVALH